MNRIMVEIYESDPFSGSCCGPSVTSLGVAMKLREMLIERDEIVNKLRAEFRENIEIRREIVSSRKSLDYYPPHARKFISENASLPFVLVNEKMIVKGKFPTFEEFRQLISEHLE